jgi:hypothetical protein
MKITKRQLRKAENAMKITKKQLQRIIKESLAEAYNSMSPRSKSLANAAKRQFAKDNPKAKVGIDTQEGWITVNGKKAVNMSQASGSPLSMGDIIDQMKQAYLGHDMEDKYAVLPADDDPAELARHKAYRDSIRLPGDRPGEHKLDFGKDIGTYNYRNEGTMMKITKTQLRRIIREERARLLSEVSPADMGMHDAAEYYEKSASDPGHAMLDLDDYEALEDTVAVAIRNLIRGGYTKEDVTAALKSIVEDSI